MLDLIRHARKPRLRLLAALGTIVALSAVSSGAAANPVTITVLASTTQQAALNIIIANFERVQSDIKIQPTYVTSSAMDTVLPTQLQAGNAPDIFRVGAGVRLTGSWTLAKAGRLLDLSGAKWNDRLYKPMAKFYKWQGKVIGWPDLVQPFGTIYNVDLFKQLGLKIPTTFPQVLALCQKINAAGKVPFAQGWKDVATANVWIPQRATQYVFNTNPNWNVDRAHGKTTFATSSSWQKTLDSIVQMKDANCFQPGSQGSTRAQAYAMFATGQSAMIQIAGAELPNILAINPNVKYEMFNLPGDGAKTSTIYSPAPTGYSANIATQHPKEVKTFFAFMAREQQASLYAKVGGGMAALDIKKGKIPDWMAPLKPLYKAGHYLGSYHSAWPNVRVFDEALAPCVLGLITGQTTPATCLANADTAWNLGANG